MLELVKAGAAVSLPEEDEPNMLEVAKAEAVESLANEDASNADVLASGSGWGATCEEDPEAVATALVSLRPHPGQPGQGGTELAAKKLTGSCSLAALARSAKDAFLTKVTKISSSIIWTTRGTGSPVAEMSLRGDCRSELASLFPLATGLVISWS